MAVPFRRTGKTAKRKRRTHYKLTAPCLVVDHNTGEFTIPHHVTRNCGYYKGKKVLFEKASVANTPAQETQAATAKAAPKKTAESKAAASKTASKTTTAKTSTKTTAAKPAASKAATKTSTAKSTTKKTTSK